jgi:hypothetical protein
MRGRRWRVIPVLGLVCSSLLAGCETAARLQEPPWTREPITDVTTVAGRWEGLMISAPRSHPWEADDWVRVMIGADGSYEFASYRMIGVFSGRGVLVPESGELVSRSERGRVACALFLAEGQRRLQVHGVTSDGVEYSANLSPAK